MNSGLHSLTSLILNNQGIFLFVSSIRHEVRVPFLADITWFVGEVSCYKIVAMVVLYKRPRPGSGG